MSAEVVRIQRGRYSPKIQVARAMITACSATASTEPAKAAEYIGAAIYELQLLQERLRKEANR